MGYISEIYCIYIYNLGAPISHGPLLATVFLGSITGRGPQRQDTPWWYLRLMLWKEWVEPWKNGCLWQRRFPFNHEAIFFVSPLSILVVKGCIYSYVNLEPSDLEVSQIHKPTCFLFIHPRHLQFTGSQAGWFPKHFDSTPVLVLVESLKLRHHRFRCFTTPCLPSIFLHQVMGSPVCLVVGTGLTSI